MSVPSDSGGRPASRRPTLLYGATVLTMDARASVVRNAEVLIDDEHVGAIGRAITAPPGTRLLDVQGCLIVPGLVQGHVHLGQTLFRGLAEGRPLLTWLRERIWPLEAAHDDESAYWSTLVGAAECLLGGTTTVQDIGLGPGIEGQIEALAESRLRATCGMCLMDTGDGLPDALRQETDRSLAETASLGDALEARGHSRLRYSINPRFVLSCSDALWRGARDLALERGWPLHTHALEHREETDATRALKDGRDEIEYFDAEGVLDADLRIAHGVWLDPRHYARVGAGRFAVVHCPSANLKLGSGMADVVGLRRARIPVAVGCDGAACSNGLDGFAELRLAGLLQQLRNGPGSFSGLDALRLATSEGAAALGLGDEIGSLEVGKQADLVVLDPGSPETWAAAQVDPHDLVAWSASRAQVRHVFVAGEHLVENGRLTHLDWEHVRHRADLAVQELLRRAGLEL